MPAQLLTYQCPHCQQAIEVDPAFAEQTVTCPRCQKPFYLGTPTTQQTPVAPHDGDRQPAVGSGPGRPAESVDGEAAEKELLTVRPVMFRRYPFRCTVYVVLVLLGLISVVLWLTKDWVAVSLVGILLGAIAGFRLLSWWLRNRTTSLTATTRRLLLKAGAFTSHSAEIPYNEILDVQVHQSLFNRVMHVGDLTLFTKMPDKQQVLVMATPEPEEVAAEIRKLRQP
jgi:uncharacterized membrane protein YdbT with pleckstrin-like domain